MTSSSNDNAIASNNDTVRAEDNDPKKPLWRFVERLDDCNKDGGNVRWKCKFCNQECRSSYTRVRAHLLSIPKQGIGACKKVTKNSVLEM